jgi:hypothetical protein
LLTNGLRAEFFESRAPLASLPDLPADTAVRSVRVTAVNTRGPGGLFGPDPLGTGLAPDFAARFTGWLSIEGAGKYTFSLGADEGARLRLGGVTIIDMPNPAAGRGFQESSASIELPSGLVPVEITFYESTGNAEIQFSLTPPGGVRRVVPQSMLVPVAAPFVAPTDGDGRFTIREVPLALENVRLRVRGSVSSAIVEVPAPEAGLLPRLGIDVGEVVLRTP